METNLRATFVGLSVVLSLCDDEQNHFYDPKIGNTVGSEIDYLGAECDEIVVALKVCPQVMTLFLNWKVLGYYHSKGHPRESYSKAFKMELEAVRPDTLTPLVEYRLNIAFLPMLLHLHQCQLDFLVDFFGRKNSLNDQFPNRCQDLEGL